MDVLLTCFSISNRRWDTMMWCTLEMTRYSELLLRSLIQQKTYCLIYSAGIYCDFGLGTTHQKELCIYSSNMHTIFRSLTRTKCDKSIVARTVMLLWVSQLIRYDMPGKNVVDSSHKNVWQKHSSNSKGIGTKIKNKNVRF